jgi:hypothetical protein
MEILQKKTKLTAIFVITALMLSAFGTTMILAQDLQPDQDLAHGTGPSADHPGTSGPAPAGADISYYFDVEPRLAFTPNPVGVNQIFTINLWVTPPPSAERFLKDYLVVIQKPDGSTDTVSIDSYVADGTAWFPYLADQVGEWKLQFHFIGMYNPPGYYSDGEYDPDVEIQGSMYYEGDYYRPTKTPVQTLTVQEEFVWSWPLIDTPTDYWTRPINVDRREWASIAGNYPWMGEADNGEWSGNPDWYGPYITAPHTSHIAWKRQTDVAGIWGGEGGVYAEIGSTRLPNVIFMGRVYDTYPVPGIGNVAGCFDLRTGEVYYEIPTAEGGVTPNRIAWSQDISGSVPGAGADDEAEGDLIAVDSTSNPEVLYKIDPYTGEVDDFDLTNDEGDGPGRIVAYLNGVYWSIRDTGNTAVRNWMEDHYWTDTDINTKNGLPTYLVKWEVDPNTNNFANRVLSNQSFTLCPSYRGSAWPPASRWRFYGRFGAPDLDYKGGFTGIARRFFDNAVWGGSALGVSLTTGKVVWERFFENAPYSPRTTVSEDGTFVICFNQGEVVGLDIETGDIKWTNKDNSYPFGGFWGYDEAAAYGNAYFWSYDGVQAFDLQTGVEVWHYNDPAVPFETTYTGADGEECYSFNGAGFVMDNLVVTRNSEHTQTAPFTRGWSTHAIDAHTGELVWKLPNAMDIGPAADGYLFLNNDYDGYLYCVGKGKSETTVEGPKTAVPKGSAVMITGTVLDLSPAQPGTPCVSDDSMDIQMGYLHMQYPIGGLYNDQVIDGVEVMLTAFDEAGNYIDIGTTTTNGYYGSFGHAWTPPDEGTYEILAQFAGSESYGSSGAATKVVVGAAPEDVDLSSVALEDSVGDAQDSISAVEDAVNSQTMYILVTLVLVIIALIISLYAVLRRK